jgi:GPH family glycoside/pentoside/hexuronide:cation symporter
MAQPVQLALAPNPATTAAPDGDRPPLGAYVAFALPLMMTALPLAILLPRFYAERTGVALAAIGLVLLGTRLVDAVIDPLLGSWVDAQKAGGSYTRPIAFAVPLLALGFVLLFVPPKAGAVATLWWLGATLTCAYIGYSLASIAYQAWGAELAHDDAGRARVTTVREGVGLLGVLLGGALPALAGYTALSLAFVVALTLGFVLLLARAQRPRRRGGVPAGNPFRQFAVPLATARFRWLLAVFALNALAPAITATVFQFFVLDRLQLSDAGVAALLALYFLAGAASMPLWARLARRVGLHRAWLIGMVAAVAAFIGAAGLGTGDAAPFAAICVLSGLAFGADLALPPALLARVIDTNGHGGQREGAYFGLWNFVNKLCLALAGGIALPLLATLGYSPGARDPAALDALAVTYAAVPCGLKLGAAALLAVAWRQRRF